MNFVNRSWKKLQISFNNCRKKIGEIIPSIANVKKLLQGKNHELHQLIVGENFKFCQSVIVKNCEIRLSFIVKNHEFHQLPWKKHKFHQKFVEKNHDFC